VEVLGVGEKMLLMNPANTPQGREHIDTDNPSAMCVSFAAEDSTWIFDKMDKLMQSEGCKMPTSVTGASGWLRGALVKEDSAAQPRATMVLQNSEEDRKIMADATVRERQQALSMVFYASSESRADGCSLEAYKKLARTDRVQGVLNVLTKYRSEEEWRTSMADTVGEIRACTSLSTSVGGHAKPVLVMFKTVVENSQPVLELESKPCAGLCGSGIHACMPLPGSDLWHPVQAR
jgi:hypothetical protein